MVLDDLFNSTVDLERFRHGLLEVGRSTVALNDALLRLRDAYVRMMAEIVEAIYREDYSFTGKPPYGGAWSRWQMLADEPNPR